MTLYRFNDSILFRNGWILRHLSLKWASIVKSYQNLLHYSMYLQFQTKNFNIIVPWRPLYVNVLGSCLPKGMFCFFMDESNGHDQQPSLWGERESSHTNAPLIHLTTIQLVADSFQMIWTILFVVFKANYGVNKLAGITSK